MTRDEFRNYQFNWIDEESLIERLCERVCCDCPAWSYEPDTGARYCPADNPTVESCVRWYEVNIYLERMVQADRLLCEAFGGRND